MLKKLNEIFGLDLRSLALYRIGIALFILGDLAIRASDLRAHYTDWGVLPRTVLLTDSFYNTWGVSLHLMSGQAWAQAVLFLIAAFFALMLLAGYRTRLASIVIWFLTISLQARNPLLLQGGDVLYRMALFFGMFLPLNGCYSVDKALSHSRDEKSARTVFSAGTAGFMLQVIFVYCFSVGVKLSLPEGKQVWWDQGLGVYYALSVDQFARPFGYFLLTLPLKILRFLNYYVLGVELFAPLLFLFPFKNSWARIIALLLIGGLHFSLNTSMILGIFPVIGTVTLIPFIPGNVWDSLGPFLASRDAAFRSFLKKQQWIQRWFEKKKKTSPARPLTLGLPPAAQIFAVSCILYIFFWNLGVTGLPHGGVPARFLGLGNTLRLDEYWGMFATPLKDDGWYVMPARLRNGKEVDVFQEGRPIRWEKPARVALTYKNDRWRKYFMNLWLAEYKGYRVYYGQYMCRQWNTTHAPEEALEEFQMFYMREDTVLYQNPVPKKVSVDRFFCFQIPNPVPPSKWES